MGLFVAVLTAAVAVQEAAPPDSVLRLIDLPGLALLDPDVVCRQFASTDPAGRGDDHGHFLSLEGKRAVLAEMDGPGVITRLWSANAAGRLQVYFDGEDEPRIDTPFQELFTGKYSPFVEPIATHQGGGWISYFPIAYRNHCRVVVDELADPAALYYQVQYLTYPRRTRINTFTRSLSRDETWNLRKVLELWKSPPSAAPATDARSILDMDEVRQRYYFELPEGSRHSDVVALRVLPGDTVPAYQANRGPGVIRYLGVELQDPRPKLLRGLVLEVTADGASGPCISVPAADLFANGFGPRAWNGLLAGGTERGGWLRMPICWRNSVAVTWRNTTDEPILGNSISSTVGPKGLSPDLGWLHAEFRTVDQVDDALYEFARTGGAGKFVGVNLTLQGVGDLWYLEGNEQLSVDGQPVPAIVGTGTEDFFNGGWYWDSGPLTLPLHGLGVKEEWTTNRTTPWRHFLPDAVPFRSGFLGRIEHGSANGVRDACYASVAFWYADSPAPVRRVEADAARLPRQWVRRPKGALPAVAMKWSGSSAMTPTRWEELPSDFRGCEYPLYQGFPISHFERDQPKVPAEVALLHGGEMRATFAVDEGDLYKLRLQMVGSRGAPRLTLRIDGRAVGELAPAAAAVGEAIAPWMSPELGPVALARGDHALTLERDRDVAGDPFTGFDCLVLASASPFVKSWWIAPPVECEPAGSVEQEPAPEAGFLAPGFEPEAAGWKEVADAGDVVDLNHHVTSRAPIFGYLATFVFSPDERVARVRLGSDDGVRVWCNGALAWSHALHRPITVDADRFDLPLRAGWNLLLVKVKNDDGGYALSLRIADVDGKLRVATRRD